jgi:hypothetical protein
VIINSGILQTPQAEEKNHLEQFSHPRRMVEQFQKVANIHEGIASADFNDDNNYKKYLNEVCVILKTCASNVCMTFVCLRLMLFQLLEAKSSILIKQKALIGLMYEYSVLQAVSQFQ